MNPARRSWLQGIVATLASLPLLGFLRPKPSFAEMIKRREDGFYQRIMPLPFAHVPDYNPYIQPEYRTATCVPQQPTTASPEQYDKLASMMPELRNARFLVIQGGTIPGMYNGLSLHIRPTHKPRYDHNPQNHAWFESVPEDWPQGVYPHAHSFAVTCDVMIGTLDELVEDYRQRLLQAFEYSIESSKLYSEDAFATFQQQLRDRGITKFTRLSTIDNNDPVAQAYDTARSNQRELPEQQST